MPLYQRDSAPSPSPPPVSYHHTSDTQAHCPTCRRVVLDTDVGEVLSSVKEDLGNLLDLVTDLVDVFQEEVHR